MKILEKQVQLHLVATTLFDKKWELLQLLQEFLYVIKSFHSFVTKNNFKQTELGMLDAKEAMCVVTAVCGCSGVFCLVLALFNRGLWTPVNNGKPTPIPSGLSGPGRNLGATALCDLFFRAHCLCRIRYNWLTTLPGLGRTTWTRWVTLWFVYPLALNEIYKRQTWIRAPGRNIGKNKVKCGESWKTQIYTEFSVYRCRPTHKMKCGLTYNAEQMKK